MGVTGLWTVVQPCARPVKLETLNRKRLAVDASIWIYQFLKAVRDKEGNALRNSHVVGFFRRICKLLFFGIKPVFVFDGGAPALKRQTVSGRKARREGRREDAVRTAGKLLAVQMQRRAEEEDRKRREERHKPTYDKEEEEVPDNLVYVEELQMTAKERQQNRQFRKKDAYHLPDLDVSLAEMGAPNDPRIMSQEELEAYARQFHTGEDINLYDFSKIDFNSSFFLSLPASDRYNIINAARLRSRLRMGYSKDQLDTMFPDRMAFSKFQIERVAERNELTQRLMNINGMNGDDAMFGVNGGGRVAGEKGKEYVLVKNDGVEGGWALGVVSNKYEGERNKPIDVEGLGSAVKFDEDDEDDWEDDGFEDVPIEGLNRLPKRHPGTMPIDVDDDYESSEAIERRRAVYEARRDIAGSKKTPRPIDEDYESLFLPQEQGAGTEYIDGDGDDDLFEDVQIPSADEEDDLNRAIAMSLEDPKGDESVREGASNLLAPVFDGPRIDQPLEFNTKNARVGRAIAHMTNARANGTSPRPFVEDNEAEKNIDLHAALAESRRTKYQPQGGSQVYGLRRPDEAQPSPTKQVLSEAAASVSSPSRSNPPEPVGFDGPLPFESLNLGKSILSKKKKKPVQEEEGGFEKEPAKPEKPAQPLPPWFTGDIPDNDAAKRTIEGRESDGGNLLGRQSVNDEPVLRRQETGEVIDLDAPKNTQKDIIEVESSSGEEDDILMGETRPVDSGVRMDDIADLIRAEPPGSTMPFSDANPSIVSTNLSIPTVESSKPDESDDEEDLVEWEASDHEGDISRPHSEIDARKPVGGNLQAEHSKSPSPDKFENIDIPGSPPIRPQSSTTIPAGEAALPSSPVGVGESIDDQTYEDIAGANNEEDIYSDPEDDDLMRQLAVEAEEHARFASTLNSKSQLQNAEDYERELRQLRNQQKKDRRDADEVSHIMVTECQQLLKLFGLPYVTAPMEAEAQCAELVSLGLVDGIVTDDSDIFLFGGTRVYKNMFNQAKFVECYLSSDLEKEYSLDRDKLIQIAHLLGSDYTEGLPSVGPVTALELLSEFPTLESFKEWWTQVQTGVQTGRTAKHLAAEDSSSPFRRKFKRNATKLFLPPTFPDKRVDHAYLHPDVDSDPSPFAWGVPDLDALRQFLMATIGWSQERTDEVLVPVIRDMNRREVEGTQANITMFFGGAQSGGGNNKESGKGGGGGGGGNAVYAPRRKVGGKSKRMESALGRLHERARNRNLGDVQGDPESDSDGNEELANSRQDIIAAGDNTEHVEQANGLAGEEGDIIISDATRNELHTPNPKLKSKSRAKRKRPAPRQEGTTSAPATDDGDEDGAYAAAAPAPRTSTKRRKGATTKESQKVNPDAR
ncbi:DNA repair protein rad2 [Lignoscripta atroalba]|nr:DNA repair protein rad2 [Lignoscripta atroalba]